MPRPTTSGRRSSRSSTSSRATPPRREGSSHRSRRRVSRGFTAIATCRSRPTTASTPITCSAQACRRARSTTSCSPGSPAPPPARTRSRSRPTTWGWAPTARRSVPERRAGAGAPRPGRSGFGGEPPLPDSSEVVLYDFVLGIDPLGVVPFFGRFAEEEIIVHDHREVAQRVVAIVAAALADAKEQRQRQLARLFEVAGKSLVDRERVGVLPALERGDHLRLLQPELALGELLAQLLDRALLIALLRDHGLPEALVGEGNAQG